MKISRQAFDEEFYLSKNPDVASAVKNLLFEDGYTHYVLFGQKECRPYRKVDLSAEEKSINSDLIFDIGMHTGVDTEFYLSKGFRVVAIEANPTLVESAKEKFSTAIENGTLFIEASGIFNEEKILDFYVNECDEWSSFQKNLGTRNNTKFHTMKVPCRRLEYFVEKYGMPYFIKIDVEGVDALVVRDLARLNGRPKFISVEDGGFDTLIALYEAGIRNFKFINQVAIRTEPCQIINAKGEYYEHHFGIASSGPFGEDLPGKWLTSGDAFKYYFDKVRPPDGPPIDGWWDIHGYF